MIEYALHDHKKLVDLVRPQLQSAVLFAHLNFRDNGANSAASQRWNSVYVLQASMTHSKMESIFLLFGLKFEITEHTPDNELLSPASE